MAHHKLALLALLVPLYVTGACAREDNKHDQDKREDDCEIIPKWGLCKPHPEKGSGGEGVPGDEWKHSKCKKCVEGTRCKKEEYTGPVWKCVPIPSPSPSPSLSPSLPPPHRSPSPPPPTRWMGHPPNSPSPSPPHHPPNSHSPSPPHRPNSPSPLPPHHPPNSHSPSPPHKPNSPSPPPPHKPNSPSPSPPHKPNSPSPPPPHKPNSPSPSPPHKPNSPSPPPPHKPNSPSPSPPHKPNSHSPSPPPTCPTACTVENFGYYFSGVCSSSLEGGYTTYCPPGYFNSGQKCDGYTDSPCGVCCIIKPNPIPQRPSPSPSPNPSPSPSPGPSPGLGSGPGPGACPYTANQDDTLFKVSQLLGYPIASITKFNPGIAPDAVLQAGQVVGIPCMTPPQAPEDVDCSAGCTPYCTKMVTAAANGSCDSTAAAYDVSLQVFTRLNPDLACNTSTTEQPAVVASITQLCVTGVLQPVNEDILDPRNPNRLTTLTYLSTAVAQIRPSLAESARTFAQAPDTDSGNFTRLLASALADDQAFAQQVTADPKLAGTVMKTLPGGGDIVGLWQELSSRMQNSAQLTDAYDCLCMRGNGKSPPLVACVGKLAVAAFDSSDAAQQLSASLHSTTDAIGRRLQHIFRQQQGASLHGLGSPQDMGGLGALDTSYGVGGELSSFQRHLLQSKFGSVTAPCDGLSAATSIQGTIEGAKKVLGKCSASLKLPVVSQVCKFVSEGKKSLNGEIPVGKLIDSYGTEIGKLKDFLTNDAFSLDVDCCVTLEYVIDVCIAAGLAVPSYFVFAEAGAYILCNKAVGQYIETTTGVQLPPLSPDFCLDLAFASKDVLEAMGASRSGYLDLSVCIGKSVPMFAICLNILEAAYYGFRGQFNLGTSRQLFFAKGGLRWIFQVHDPWDRICRNKDLATSKDYCCMCNGENWGEGYFQGWLFLKWVDLFGSPWKIKNPPDCQKRYDANERCSRRQQVEETPLPDDPKNHNFEVNAVYTTDWAQWRKSNNGRPPFCDPYATTPKHLDPTLYTHVFYAFAKVILDTFEVVNVEWNDDALTKEIPKNSQTPDFPGFPAGPVKIISIGGWSFSRADQAFKGTGSDKVFPALASSQENRAKFITSAIKYAKDKGFGGIDIDWEFPNFDNNTAQERLDFTALLKEMYPACQQAGLLLTAATRATHANQHYELATIHKFVDWFNIMSYDFYGGSFSKINKLNAPIVDCQSRACGKPLDISTGLQEYLAAGVPPNKLVLGLATYGRTFALSNPTGGNPAPGTAVASGVAPPGTCTLEKDGGVLAWYEIKELGIQPKVDGPGMAAYASYGPGNSYWVGFDTPDTLKRKVCWAASRQLRGTFAWDSNLDDDQELLRAVRATWNHPRECPVFQPESCPDGPSSIPCESAPSAPTGGGGPADAGAGGAATYGGPTCKYTIKAGDTFYSIASTRGVSVKVVISLNPGVEPTKLQVDQVVTVPCGSGSGGSGGGKSCPYTIKAEDTFATIASTLKTTVEAIIELNPGVDPKLLQVGQVINVPCPSSG